MPVEGVIGAFGVPTDMAVDPASIPETMTRDQLEWWVLFTIAVAGKTAKQIEKKMRAFMNLGDLLEGPFGRVRMMIQEGKLLYNLRKVKLGKYTLLNKGFRKAVTLDLDLLEQAVPTDALKMLLTVPGIGFKGARMVLLYSRPAGLEMVPLDTHVLKFLKTIGVSNVPKSTPSSETTYLRLESAFIAEAKRLGLSVRELDTKVWTSYAIK